ncbi:MAG: hypothetical protein EA425_17815 [Puniceicoccaceae bacterium]|nr:MAG: hypothetical protein EA425_17815 [Puniceicoccaceae bacterium]
MAPVNPGAMLFSLTNLAALFRRSGPDGPALRRFRACPPHPPALGLPSAFPNRFMLPLVRPLPVFVLVLMILGSLVTETSATADLDRLRAAHQAAPESPEAALQLGLALHAAGLSEEARRPTATARRLLQERLPQADAPAVLHYQLGLAENLLQNHAAAVAALREAVRLAPDREPAHLALAQSLGKSGDLNGAVAALDLAAVLFPDSSRVPLTRARILLAAGDPAAALPILQTLHKKQPDDPGIIDALITACRETDATEPLRKLYDHLVESGTITTLERALQLYDFHLLHDRPREARRFLQEASRIDPDHPLVRNGFRHYFRSLALNAEAEGNHTHSILHWQRALAHVPDDIEARHRIALAHARSGNHDQALPLYQELLRERPADPAFYAHFALTLIATDRADLADRLLRLGESIPWPDDPEGKLASLYETAEGALHTVRTTAPGQSLQR